MDLRRHGWDQVGRMLAALSEMGTRGGVWGTGRGSGWAECWCAECGLGHLEVPPALVLNATE